MDKAEAIELVKQYKEVILPRLNNEAEVYMYGSYSKGTQRPESDIDVAVIIPSAGEDWFSLTKGLWHDVDKVSLLIEPVLIEKSHPSPLYEDVIRTGIAV
jgi:predicted nucleotidyltransferase